MRRKTEVLQHREEVAPAQGRSLTDDDGFAWVETYLGTWARWMRNPELKLGAPTRSAAFLVDITGGYRDRAEEAEIAGHNRAVDVINGTLDDLSAAESAAVMHIHLYAVFRLRARLEDVYLSARQRIGIRLRAHGFY